MGQALPTGASAPRPRLQPLSSSLHSPAESLFSSSSRRIPPAVSVSPKASTAVAHFLSRREMAGPSGNSESASPRNPSGPTEPPARAAGQLLKHPGRTSTSLRTHPRPRVCPPALSASSAPPRPATRRRPPPPPPPLGLCASWLRRSPSTPEPSAHRSSHLG